MNILAIDTSDLTSSLALSTSSGEVYKLNSKGDNLSHNEELQELLDELISTSNITYQDLDLIIIGQGPGSFTGLRIGFSYAMGLATGLKIPLIQQCSLSAAFFAEHASKDKFQKIDSNVLVISDARRDEFFTLKFSKDSLVSTSREVVIMGLAEVKATSADYLLAFKNLSNHSCMDEFSNIKLIQDIGIGHIEFFKALGEEAGVYKASEISASMPNYVRSVNAMTIKERSANT